MEKKEIKKEKSTVERDFDKEIKDIFDNALKELDPEIMETIKVVSLMNETESSKLQVKTFSNGTVNTELTYAE